jgi:hypothetical protein
MMLPVRSAVTSSRAYLLNKLETTRPSWNFSNTWSNATRSSLLKELAIEMPREKGLNRFSEARSGGCADLRAC